MIHVAFVTHQSPGRLRLKVPSARGDDEWFLRAKTQFETHANVQTVEVNSRTASLLVHHDGNGEEIVYWAQTQSLLEKVNLSEVPQRSIAAMARQGVQHFDAALRTASGGMLDIGSVLLVTFSTLAALQFLRGEYAGPVSTLVEQSLRSLSFVVSTLQE